MSWKPLSGACSFHQCASQPVPISSVIMGPFVSQRSTNHMICRCRCCRGGCDNCSAAEAGGGAERDMAPQARLLLATVQVWHHSWDVMGRFPAATHSVHPFAALSGQLPTLLLHPACLPACLPAAAARDGAGHSGAGAAGEQVRAWRVHLQVLLSDTQAGRGMRALVGMALPRLPAISPCHLLHVTFTHTYPFTPHAYPPCRAQKMKPWMLEMAAPDGTRLHNAGVQYSEAWWKVSEWVLGEAGSGKGGHSGHAPSSSARRHCAGQINPAACWCAPPQALAGMLTGRGFLASQTRAPPGQRAYAVIICTEQGAEFLRGQQPLVLPLSGDMLAQEAAVQQAAEAAAAARLAAEALEAAKNVVQAEEQRLFKVLQDVRKVSQPASRGVGAGRSVSQCVHV